MSEMRELNEVDPVPATELEILRHGLTEIALQAPGSHQDPSPGYDVKRQISDYARRILDGADPDRTYLRHTAPVPTADPALGFSLEEIEALARAARLDDWGYKAQTALRSAHAKLALSLEARQ